MRPCYELSQVLTVKGNTACNSHGMPLHCSVSYYTRRSRAHECMCGYYACAPCKHRCQSARKQAAPGSVKQPRQNKTATYTICKRGIRVIFCCKQPCPRFAGCFAARPRGRCIQSTHAWITQPGYWACGAFKAVSFTGNII